MTEFKNNIAVVNLYEPQDQAGTDTASNILDTAQFNGAAIAVQVGALTGVDGSNYLVPTMQESDTLTGTDFADVNAADLIGSFTKIDATSEDSVVQYCGYQGNKRYLRVNCNYTGSGITAGIVGVIGILGLAGNKPVTPPAALAAV